MNDNRASSSDPAEKPGWEISTGRWMVDQLQLRPRKPEKSSQGLAPEDVQRLQNIAKPGTTRFYFPEKLENRFTQEQRQSNRIERLTVSILTAVFFALGPLWADWVLSLPDGARTLELWLCLGVIVPAFTLVAFLQYYFVTSELAEASLLLAFSAEVIVIEVLRLNAAALGVYIVPTMTAAVPIGVFALIGLSFRRRTVLFVGYFAMLVIVDKAMGDSHAGRDVSVWISEFVMVSLAWMASLFNRISIRRAWAANILLEISASQDPLTGLANRSAFEERYEQQMRLGLRYGKSSASR